MKLAFIFEVNMDTLTDELDINEFVKGLDLDSESGFVTYYPDDTHANILDAETGELLYREWIH